MVIQQKKHRQPRKSTHAPARPHATPGTAACDSPTMPHPSLKIGRQKRDEGPNLMGPAARTRSGRIQKVQDDYLRPEGRRVVWGRRPGFEARLTLHGARTGGRARGGVRQPGAALRCGWGAGVRALRARRVHVCCTLYTRRAGAKSCARGLCAPKTGRGGCSCRRCFDGGCSMAATDLSSPKSTNRM